MRDVSAANLDRPRRIGFVVKSALLSTLILAGACGTAQAALTDQYGRSCATCHQSGVLGAPKSGDKAAWALRMKQGMPVMIKHAKEGYKNMPARGLCNTCTDEEYAALIKMMAN